MTTQDIEYYVIRHNLNIPSRKPEHVYQRTFLYGYLYHHYKWSLVSIAKLFNKKDHVSIIHALKNAETIQHYDDYITATKLLREQVPYVIPPYATKKYTQKKIKKEPSSFSVTVKLNKDDYIQYLKAQDKEIIYNALWKIFIQKIK